MYAPRSMTANTLNALKGWPQPAAVDFNTQFAATITDTVLPGSVVHLDADGMYELGVGTLSVMPLFMFNGSDDPDVQNYGGDPTTKAGVWVPISPTGQAMALVAVGAYELVAPHSRHPPSSARLKSGTRIGSDQAVRDSGMPFPPAIRPLSEESYLWVPKTSSAGWIDAKRAVKRKPY